MQFENKDFVHWHCHSEFSQLDGLSKIDELVLTARKMGFPALALTDHGNLMGWIKFIQKCIAKKDKNGNEIPYPTIKPILGQEFYVSRQMNIGQYDLNKDTEKIKQLQPDGRKGNRHLNLYAMNIEGYKNICRLSQAAYTEGFYYDPRIDLDILSKHSSGVMVGSACLGSVINFNLLNGRYEIAKKISGVLNDIFKNNFFLEIMYHGIPEEQYLIPLILKLSSEINVPVLATADSHYIDKSDAKSQEILLCMSQKKCIKDDNRLKFSYGEFYLKSAEEMAKIFGNIPHVLTNTFLMSERIDYKDIENNLFGGMRLPKFDVPKEFDNPYDYMCKLAWEGLKKNGWDSSPKHVEALKMEMEDIKIALDNNNYHFDTYFLIVKDIIDYAKSEGILTGAGRGSCYASILLRCLGITYGLDPIEEKLLWTRFLGFDKKRVINASDFGFSEDISELIASVDNGGEEDGDDNSEE